MMDTEFNIEECIKKLKDSRDIFHSEADFQFALAWEIQRKYPEADIRLEYCVKDVPKIHIEEDSKEDVSDMHIDIMVSLDDRCIPIELKYKTAKFEWTDIKGERYNLRNHGAQPLGRYDFIKDVRRLEVLSDKLTNCQEGYAIWLTNDKSYLNLPSRDNAISKEFSVHHGAIKTGRLEWSEKAGAETTKNRKDKIRLKNSYNIKWHPYSTVGNEDTKNREFHYSIIKV